VEVAHGSVAAGFLQSNDVILSLNNKPVNKLPDLFSARVSVIIGTHAEMVLFRNQKEEKKWVDLEEKK